MPSIRHLPGNDARRILPAVLAALLGWGPASPLLAREDPHAGHDHGASTQDPPHAIHESEPSPIDEPEGHDAAHPGGALDDKDTGHDEEDGLYLTPGQRDRFGIVVAAAGPGRLLNEVQLTGEIVFNEDHVVHMAPRVAGIVRDVYHGIGDRVGADEPLAVLDSRELADAKAEYLAANARTGLAERTFRREKTLLEKQVSSEQEYLEAEQALAAARIAQRTAAQKLHALGLGLNALQALPEEADAAFARYTVVAPIEGVITHRHISRGESVAADADIFTIVDLDSVWVRLAVYAKDLALVRAGQKVILRPDHGGPQAHGTVAMVTPFVETSTRTATARVVLANDDGRWTPGTFVTAFLAAAQEDVPIVVPREAVQRIDERDVVFVEHEGRFEAVAVTPGRADRTRIEIVSGLEPGTRYVAHGAFHLKATAITSTLDSHAGHGH